MVKNGPNPQKKIFAFLVLCCWTYFVNMPRVISLSQTRRQMIISKMDFYKRVNTRKELFGRKKRSTPFIIYTNFSMDRMRKLSEKENIFPTKRLFSLCCNVCCWADADGGPAGHIITIMPVPTSRIQCAKPQQSAGISVFPTNENEASSLLLFILIKCSVQFSVYLKTDCPRQISLEKLLINWLLLFWRLFRRPLSKHPRPVWLDWRFLL